MRPDSGDPPTVVIEVLNRLGEKFGYTRNQKGYKVLPDQVRVIQGDGCDYAMVRQILAVMDMMKWSADNIAFGMGGALLQKMDRDTQKCAFKCSAVTVNGEERDVYKDPITDHGKASKAGRLKLIREEGAHGSTYRTVPFSEEGEDQLVEVFRDGKVLVDHSFEDIRARAGNFYLL